MNSTRSWVRQRKKRALAVILVCFVAVTSAYHWRASQRDLAVPPPGRLVSIGQHRLHLWCTGSGTPTVILEASLGGSSLEWSWVQPGIAQFTQVCSYDRAGMGYSEEGPSPRTSRVIARELATLLDRGGIAGPVVVVGASFGVYNARVFAGDYAGRVAGLVLVNASHEDQDERLEALISTSLPLFLGRVVPFASHAFRAAIRFGIPVIASMGIPRLFGVAVGPGVESVPSHIRQFAAATGFRTTAYTTAVDEFTHAADSAQQLRESRRALTIPLVIVSAGRPPHVPGLSTETATKLSALLRTLQQDQLRLSTRSCQIVAARSGHLAALEQPDVVVEAVLTTVRAVRTGADVTTGNCHDGGERK